MYSFGVIKQCTHSHLQAGFHLDEASTRKIVSTSEYSAQVKNSGIFTCFSRLVFPDAAGAWYGSVVCFTPVYCTANTVCDQTFAVYVSQ